METRRDDLQELVGRYAEAWNSHDIDSIMKLHTADTQYQAHGRTDLVIGQEAVAAAFRRDLDLLPDVHFDPVSLHGGRDHVVFQSRITGTLSGSPYVADGIDLLIVRDGLVHAKHTYLGVSK